MKPSELEIDLGTVRMHCTPDEIAATLQWLLLEMRTVTPRLRADERDVLRRIMSHENGTLTVGELFPDFARESEGHKTLRRLRAAQFVRPAKTGHWVSEERIEVKPFGRLMWDRVGEARLFFDSAEVPLIAPDEEAVPQAEPVAEQPVEEVIDLAEIEEAKNAEAEEAKEVEEPAAAEKAAKWDEEALDLRDYDDLCQYAEEELRGKR
jgi:hypothetical protein